MTTITTSINVTQTFVNTMLWPITIANGTSSNIIILTFSENITLDNVNQYFICNSNYIQFGSKTLNSDGTRPIITVNASNYDGLIQNGSNVSNGFNNVSIFNLYIDGSNGTQQIGAGWFGQKYYGKTLAIII